MNLLLSTDFETNEEEGYILFHYLVSTVLLGMLYTLLFVVFDIGNNVLIPVLVVLVIGYFLEVKLFKLFRNRHKE